MLVWSTQIPILPTRTIDDLAALCAKWITGSPHSSWSIDRVPTALEGEIVVADQDAQKIAVGRITTADSEFFGFRHHWRDLDNREWITEIMGWRAKSIFLVGVHLYCQTSGIGVRVTEPKKPYVVRQILDELGGDVDGDFQVSSEPRILTECEIDIAKRVLTGETRHYLPIVYVSSTWRNRPALDAEKLAQWTGGMAHVVVEPSRAFSFILAGRVAMSNPYEGAVSIIWPEGGGAPSRFFPYRFGDPIRYASAIDKILRKALANRRPDPRITWDHLRGIHFRNRIDRLKEAGTASVDEYIDAFDQERKLTTKRVDELEEDNTRLKQQLASYESQKAYAQVSDGEFLRAPKDRELFPGEFSDILIRALKRARDNSQPDGRVRDVLNSFISANDETGESQQIEDQIRKALRNCNALGANERRAMEEVGFSFSDEGKHYKLVFRGDDRYTFAMAKTGSDWRGMKNWISDATKRLFK